MNSPMIDVAKPVLLLVDDDSAVLEALEAELATRFGDLCRIEAFTRAAEALEAVQRWREERRPIALAIVDQRMPGVTGLELVRQLQSEARSAGESGAGFHPAASARTILLTGFGGPGVAAAAEAEPAVTRYREKPWRGEVLVQDVRDLLLEFGRVARAGGASLGSAWEQLEPRPRVTGATTHAPDRPEVETEPDDERLRILLRSAQQGREGSWPSVEALQAFLLGVASPEQLSEVRAAALESESFRSEIAHLSAQFGMLAHPEARLAFDQAPVPDAIRRLFGAPDDDSSR